MGINGDVVYAYTSKGTKEKCSKNGVGCVRHPVHIAANGKVETSNWFGSGVVKSVSDLIGLEVDTCAADGCENYPNSELVDNGAGGTLCGLHFYNSSDEKPAAVNEYASDYVDPDSLSSDYNTRASALRRKNVREVRTLGIGSNFKVLDPKDGVKGDDSIWFGKCDKCGETVSSDERLGIWEHRVTGLNAEAEQTVDYKADCPTEISRTHK
jgi:hypothetical protein